MRLDSRFNPGNLSSCRPSYVGVAKGGEPVVEKSYYRGLKTTWPFGLLAANQENQNNQTIEQWLLPNPHHPNPQGEHRFRNRVIEVLQHSGGNPVERKAKIEGGPRQANFRNQISHPKEIRTRLMPYLLSLPFPRRTGTMSSTRRVASTSQTNKSHILLRIVMTYRPTTTRIQCQPPACNRRSLASYNHYQH